MLFSFENIYRHYIKCRRNKRNTHNALRFEANHELNLLQLQKELQDHSYRPARSVCFVTKRPKLREIFAADFRDRVVHHVLVDHLEQYWERVFIYDAYACRKNRGVHKGVNRLQRFMRQASGNGSRPIYYLQLDIQNFFMRIDKAILWDMLDAHIEDEDARWLTQLLVFFDCTRDPVIKGSASDLALLPDHKTLMRSDPGKGLPIGNLNSQFFANIYLNGLDQFVKHQLKCKHYLRYCDDFVLLHSDPEQLLDWKWRIADYLKQSLALELNPTRHRLASISNGVDFLGYIVRRDYLLVRRRVVNHLKVKLDDFQRVLVGDWRGRVCYRFDEELLDKLHATLSSYWGHFRLANSHQLKQSIWKRYSFLEHYFEWQAEDLKIVR